MFSLGLQEVEVLMGLVGSGVLSNSVSSDTGLLELRGLVIGCFQSQEQHLGAQLRDNPKTLKSVSREAQP